MRSESIHFGSSNRRTHSNRDNEGHQRLAIYSSIKAINKKIVTKRKEKHRGPIRAPSSIGRCRFLLCKEENKISVIYFKYYLLKAFQITRQLWTSRFIKIKKSPSNKNSNYPKTKLRQKSTFDNSQ